MEYTFDELAQLVEAVEEQGGELTDLTCTDRVVKLTGPNAKPAKLRYCRNDTIFEVPYEAADKEGRSMGLQPIQVCAVDDNMGAWPRFGGDRIAAVLDAQDMEDDEE